MHLQRETEAATGDVLWKKVPEACNFIKNEALAQVFSCEFCEISKNNFFTEHLPTTASRENLKTAIFKKEQKILHVVNTFISIFINYLCYKVCDLIDPRFFKIKTYKLIQ